MNWRERGEMETERYFFPLHFLYFSPFPLFPFNSSHFLSIYGICRECRKNLSIWIRRKYFWIKTGCKEALQLNDLLTSGFAGASDKCINLKIKSGPLISFLYILPLFVVDKASFVNKREHSWAKRRSLNVEEKRRGWNRYRFTLYRKQFGERGLPYKGNLCWLLLFYILRTFSVHCQWINHL